MEQELVNSFNIFSCTKNQSTSSSSLQDVFHQRQYIALADYFKALPLNIRVISGLCPQPLKLPSVLAAIPVSGCHQARPGSCSHRDSPQLHHRAQLLWPAPDTAGLARLVAALSVIRLAATAAVSYRARRVDTRNTRVSSTTAPDTTASWSW